MIYVEPGAMEACRIGKCEACLWPGPCVGHHLFTRGAGEVTIAENLIRLCTNCHAKNHNGNEPTSAHLLALAAKRHGIKPTAIQEAVWRIRRLPKGASQVAVDAILAELRRGYATRDTEQGPGAVQVRSGDPHPDRDRGLPERAEVQAGVSGHDPGKPPGLREAGGEDAVERGQRLRSDSDGAWMDL